MKKLKSLLLVYEDGTEKRLDISEIDTSVQSALTASGLSAAPSEILRAKNYLIIEWKDGWQEVIAINSEVAELLRYYVIRRIEDKGRLVLNTGNDYPELLIVERTPMDISHLSIVSDSDIKSYDLQLEIEGYEGTFEAGGKKEFTRYDRENPHFKNEFSTSPESINYIKNAVAAELAEKKLLPNEVLSMDKENRIPIYAEIAGTAGIKGVKRQSDIYGFIELVLKKLVSEDA
ncbi:hypothetical protein ACFLYN_03635 [Chloroflexota bacterium]